ncbi:hypothetical protein L211DRAFT_578305 [Terfezia boudieri ATCC MYA-4762]|uniref:Uncharacterized protein n=1 Tax=Terfezia boudieri ATCC MYA-4762 TaxID=1051890 RepID=A0A3N4LBG6_9PEZI|nr:hypothetical protein L211DRAFT_578305 [Terfezia boudieri ATCC MYA-4762]
MRPTIAPPSGVVGRSCKEALGQWSSKMRMISFGADCRPGHEPSRLETWARARRSLQPRNTEGTRGVEIFKMRCIPTLSSFFFHLNNTTSSDSPGVSLPPFRIYNYNRSISDITNHAYQHKRRKLQKLMK